MIRVIRENPRLQFPRATASAEILRSRHAAKFDHDRIVKERSVRLDRACQREAAACSAASWHFVDHVKLASRLG